MLLIMVHYLMLWTAATTYDDAPRQRARYHARAGAGPVQHHVEALLRRGAHAAARRVRSCAQGSLLGGHWRINQQHCCCAVYDRRAS